MSKHATKTENIYNSLCIQQLEQQYCSSCSAAVVSSCCVVSSRGLGARLVSRIYDGGRKAVYTATVGAMLANNLTPYAGAATITVSSGVVSTGLTVSSGNYIYVNGGGLASGVDILEHGMLTVYRNGSALDVNQHTYGKIDATVAGEDSTLISGTNADGGDFLLSGGYASGFVVNSGAELTVSSGGRAENITQSAGGNITVYVESGDGTYVSGRNQAGSVFTLIDGHASNFIINDGGFQYISTGGTADNTIVSGGGQNIYSGGAASNTTLIGGTVFAADGGTVSNIEQSGGIVRVSSGGQALNVVQSGGHVTVNIYGGDSTTKITGSNISNGAFYVSNGIASNLITDDMTLAGAGASANSTYVYGYQYISSGARADNTTLNTGASQHISAGGIASNTVLNSSSYQYCYFTIFR